MHRRRLPCGHGGAAAATEEAQIRVPRPAPGRYDAPPTMGIRRHRPPLNELQPQRICLIKPSALGDIVQTLPVLSLLRRRFPQAHIAWVVKDSLAGILRGHPELDQLICLPYPRGAWARWRSLRATLRRLRAERFDLAIDLQGLLRSGLLTWATAAPRRVGTTLAREGAWLAYTDCIESPPWSVPAWRRYLVVARALGCGEEAAAGVVPVTDAQRQWARQRLGHLPRPRLAIHPGAQWVTKRWPPEHFAALAYRAQCDYGAAVVLVGGGGEEPLCDRIARGLPAAVCNLAGQTSLLQLAAVIQQCDLFLSGDTGPLHLAAALGVPVVGVFTCTSPIRSGPCGNGHRTLATRVACAASYRKRCRSLACMRELTPARVWPAVQRGLHEATQRLAGGTMAAG
jgi:heptosyltransferase-1